MSAGLPGREPLASRAGQAEGAHAIGHVAHLDHTQPTHLVAHRHSLVAVVLAHSWRLEQVRHHFSPAHEMMSSADWRVVRNPLAGLDVSG